MGIYDRYAKTKLLDAIKAFETEAPLRESLEAEVDVARALTGEALKVASAVLDPEQGSKLSNDIRDSAIKLTMESLDFVSKLVERMVKVRAVSAATLSIRQVEDVCARVVKIIRSRLTDEILANSIVEDIMAMTIAGKETPRVQISLD